MQVLIRFFAEIGFFCVVVHVIMEPPLDSSVRSLPPWSDPQVQKKTRRHTEVNINATYVSGCVSILKLLCNRTDFALTSSIKGVSHACFLSCLYLILPRPTSSSAELWRVSHCMTKKSEEMRHDPSDWGCYDKHQTCTWFRTTYESGLGLIWKNLICAGQTIIKHIIYGSEMGKKVGFSFCLQC